MTFNGYQKLALRTANFGLKEKEVLTNGALGLVGEAGEVADLVKKHLFQGHDLDRERIIGELGDVAWYMSLLAHAVNVPLEEVFSHNIQKLRNRYPDGFDSEMSKHRKEGDV